MTVDPHRARQLIDTYRERADALLQSAMNDLQGDSQLEEACRYAVLSPGKRLRPILLIAIAQALDAPCSVDSAAVAVEMFHCASLIVDDLPCMDDDDFRRGQPTLHKVYGEAVAIMATLALISMGYSAIYANAMHLADREQRQSELRGLLAVQNVAFNAGIEGATGGQFIDLFSKEPSVAQLEEILRKKTASIFEISCVLGWLFGGGPLEQLSEVKALAFNLGMAYQILDDLEDLEQDSERNPINYALAIGPKKAKQKALEHLMKCHELIISLHLNTPLLQAILAAVGSKA